MKQESGHEKTRFIVLLLLVCLFLVVLSATLWWVPYVGFTSIHPSLPLIMGLLMAGAVLYLLGGALTLVFTIIRGKNLFFNRRIRGVVISWLFPLLVMVGKLVGIRKDQVRRSFVAVNNQLVLAESQRLPPERILILLPHCLQFHECPVRITMDVENCKDCGRCKIKDLRALGRSYGVPIAVATGGTLARKIVVEKKPDLIVAVACERDLTSGIQDSYPIPVFGVLNRRPNGPCFDTDVDLELVEKGLRTFLKDAKKQTQRPRPVGADEDGEKDRALG